MKLLLKKIGWALAIIIGLAILLLILPRLLSVFSSKPIGYHFETPLKIALVTGLEKMVNTDPAIPESMEAIKDIEYKNIDGLSMQLDIYKDKNLKEKVPLIVFIHGGSWKWGKRGDYKFYTVSYAQKGYVTATVSYRLSKVAPHPACIEDVTDAVQWLYDHAEDYGYDRDKIALFGGSAGAHLALLTAYGWQDERQNDSINHTFRIKSVVDIYGPIDLTVGSAKESKVVSELLAHSYDDAPELYWEASPLKYISKNSPPTFILHGTSDNLVSVSQSDTLQSRLNALGVPTVYCRLPLWPHVMDVDKRVNEYAQEKIDRFFEQYLR